MERIKEVVASLGYEEKDCKSWHTYDLVKHYRLTESL